MCLTELDGVEGRDVVAEGLQREHRDFVPYVSAIDRKPDFLFDQIPRAPVSVSGGERRLTQIQPLINSQSHIAMAVHQLGVVPYVTGDGQDARIRDRQF